MQFRDYSQKKKKTKKTEKEKNVRERITCVDVGLLDFRPMGLIPLQIFCGKV